MWHGKVDGKTLSSSLRLRTNGISTHRRVLTSPTATHTPVGKLGPSSRHLSVSQTLPRFLSAETVGGSGASDAGRQEPQRTGRIWRLGVVWKRVKGRCQEVSCITDLGSRKVKRDVSGPSGHDSPKSLASNTIRRLNSVDPGQTSSEAVHWTFRVKLTTSPGPKTYSYPDKTR